MNDRSNLVERASLAIAVACCALLVSLSLIDVLCRALGVKFYLASETSGFLMGWLIFFALPVVTRQRRHISVEFLVNLMPRRLRDWVEIFGEAAMLAYIGVLIALCSQITYDTWANDIRAPGILRFPKFYPFLGIMIGSGLLFLSQALLVLRLVRAATSGAQPSQGGSV